MNSTKSTQALKKKQAQYVKSGELKCLDSSGRVAVLFVSSLSRRVRAYGIEILYTASWT